MKEKAEPETEILKVLHEQIHIITIHMVTGRCIPV